MAGLAPWPLSQLDEDHRLQESQSEKSLIVYSEPSSEQSTITDTNSSTNLQEHAEAISFGGNARSADELLTITCVNKPEETHSEGLSIRRSERKVATKAQTQAPLPGPGKQVPFGKRRPSQLASPLRQMTSSRTSSSGSDVSIASEGGTDSLGCSSNSSPTVSEQSFKIRSFWDGYTSKARLRSETLPRQNVPRLPLKESASLPSTPRSLRLSISERRANLHSICTALTYSLSDSKSQKVQRGPSTEAYPSMRHLAISEPTTPTSTVDPTSRSKARTFPGSYRAVRSCPRPPEKPRPGLVNTLQDQLKPPSPSTDIKTHFFDPQSDVDGGGLSSHWSDSEDENDIFRKFLRRRSGRRRPELPSFWLRPSSNTQSNKSNWF